jgi:hypothetical protein
MFGKYFKKPVYYAHSLRHYGTKKEKKDARMIGRLTGLRVLNPKGKLSNNSSWVSEAYLLIDKCQMLVFTEYQGTIGKGVYTEIQYALEKRMPVYLLHDGNLLAILKRDLHLVRHGENWVKYARVLYELF